MPKKKSHVANDTLFGQGNKLFRGKKARKHSGMFKKGSARKKGDRTASGNISAGNGGALQARVGAEAQSETGTAARAETGTAEAEA